MAVKPGPARVLNRAELAAFHGASLDTIDGWIKAGCPAEERGSQGRSYRFNSAAVIAWRIARERSDAVAGLGAGVDTMTREEADRRRAIASMKLAEIEADTAHGGVVLRADVEADIASFCGVLHTGLGSASNRIASRATSMTNAAEIEDLCRTELNRSFDSAKVELAEKWSNGA